MGQKKSEHLQYSIINKIVELEQQPIILLLIWYQKNTKDHETNDVIAIIYSSASKQVMLMLQPWQNS